MGQSNLLGASSTFIGDFDLDFLGSHKTSEDEIYKQVLRIRGVAPVEGADPSSIMQFAETDKNFLKSLYPGSSSEDAYQSLRGRLDRCLVASLASSLTNKRHILETGTFTGFTSAFALLGLCMSSGGLLYTVDLPTSESVTQIHHIDSSDIGGTIKLQKNRNRVVQVIEDAKSAIPRILFENCVDMFLHTVTHQMYEYIVSRAFMPLNSILVSDDILWNPAFVSYVRLFELPFWVCATNPNYGIAVNVCHPQEKDFAWGRLSTSDYIERINGI